MKVLIGHYASRNKIGEIERFEMRSKRCNAKELIDHDASKTKIGEIERDAP